MDSNFKRVFKKQTNKLGRMLLLYQICLISVVFIHVIFMLIYLSKTMGLTDHVLDELLITVMESGTSSILGTLVGMVVIVIYRGKGLFSYDLVTEKQKMEGKIFLKIFLCFMSVQAVFSVTSIGIETVLNSFGYTMLGQIESATSTSTTLSMFLYVSIIGPIAEEVVFRGALLRGLEKYGKLFAVIVSSVLFGAFHGNLIQGFFAAIVGLILGYVTMEYSIKWAIVLHVVNNCIFGDVLGFILNHFSPTHQTIFNIIMLSMFFIGGLFVLFQSRNSIENYITANRSEKRLYQYTFSSLWIVFYLVINLWLAIDGIEKIV